MDSLVRDGAPPMSLARRIGRSIRAVMSDFGPFKTDAGWSIVSGQSPTDYERTGRTLRLMGFEANPVVSACMRLIAETTATPVIELYRTGKDGKKTIDVSNPGNAVLAAPRVGWNRYRFVMTTVAHFIGYGNAFWCIVRDQANGLPSGLQLVFPEQIQYVYLDPDTQEPQLYEWVDRLGRRQRTTYLDMVHFRDLTLTDSVFGFPRAAAALLDIVTDGEASKYVRQVLGNDGSPRLVIGLKSITTENTARAADERWHEQAIERGNRGRVRFLPGVEQVHQIGFNLRELEFPSLRQVSREDICAVFNVDPRMISVASAKGNEGGLSGQQYSEARRRLYQQACLPVMTALEAEMDVALCPEFGQVRARFSPEDIADMMEDVAETSTRLLEQMTAGGITREEFRRGVGRDEKMKPTDTLVGTLARLEYPVALQFATSPKDPANTPDPNATLAVDPAAQPRALPTGVVRSRILTRGTVLTDEQRTMLWQLFDTRATREEIVYRRAALLLFATERDGVRSVFAHWAAQMPDGKRDVDPSDPLVMAALREILHAYNAADGEYHRAWLERYRALIGATMEVAGKDVAAGAGVSFNLENPRTQAAIASRAQRLADLVTKTTADQITAAVAAGREAGMGIRQIAELIDASVFDSQAPVRAERIARTETVGALNQGEHEAALATGVIRSHAWLSQRDGKVRESHVGCDAQGFIAMESRFENGLLYPGDPDGDADEVVNCRCSQLFSDEEPTP